MDWLIDELDDFNQAAQAVVDWVDSPVNDSSWSNTLVIITGDHETGYLARAPGLFPDQPIEQVNDIVIGLEKIELTSGRRASWLDETPVNGQIDEGETVYWSWGSSGDGSTTVNHGSYIYHGAGVMGLAGAAVNNKGMAGIAYKASLWPIQANSGSGSSLSGNS
jgi:hypothetical protein